MINQIIGYAASSCLIITLMPQLLKTFKDKKVNDISFGFISLNLLTCVLFLIYGILLDENPIILANCILIVQNWLLLFFKIKYSNQNQNQNQNRNQNQNQNPAFDSNYFENFMENMENNDMETDC